MWEECELRVASCKLRVAGDGKLTSSVSVRLFSQFKEIKRYILGLKKTLSNDHVLSPTALDLKPFSDNEFKFWKQRNTEKACRLSKLSNEYSLSTMF